MDKRLLSERTHTMATRVDPRIEQQVIRDDTRRYFLSSLSGKVSSSASSLLSLIDHVLEGAKQHDLLVSSVKSFASLGPTIEKEDKVLHSIDYALREMHHVLQVTAESVDVVREMDASLRKP